MRTTPWLVALTLALLAANASAETRYITSLKAKLAATPDFKAAQVAQLDKGTSIEVIETQGTWLKVQVDNQTGWVMKFATSDSPPTERVTVFPAKNQTETLKNFRLRTSAITTAASARGLAEGSRVLEEGGTNADFDAVNYLDGVEVSPQELTEFAQPLQ